MGISLQKFVIENDFPLGVVDLSMAMRHKCTVGSFSTNTLHHEGLEGVREL
jgi:hypothetical protein